MAFPDLALGEISAGKPRVASPISTALQAIETWGKGNIVAADLASNSITTAKITDANVTTAKIADDNVTNAKLDHTNGHIVLSPETDKFVKIAVLRQDDTTNDYKNNSVILTGWGYIRGTGAVNSRAETVTFGITFDATPVVLQSTLYKLQTGAPTDIGDFVDQDSRTTSQCGDVTTSSFEQLIAFGYTADTSQYHGYSWIAIGELAA